MTIPPTATLPRRLLAYALDSIWLWALLMGAQGLLQVTVVGHDAPWRASGPLLELWTITTISLPAWLSLAAFDASRPGATPGKRLLGIRVVGHDRAAVRFGRAVGRNVVKLAPWETAHLAINLPQNPFIDPETGAFTDFASGDFRVAMVLPYAVAALWLGFAWHGRALHDRLAGTDVIRCGTGTGRGSAP